MNKKNAQLVEKKINNILFYLCLSVTIVALAMTLVRFFTRGEFPPANIGVFYVGVLLIYSVHKEALRWILDKEEKRRQRQGEYFVYLWIVITTFLYLVNFVKKDHFRFSPYGNDYHILTETAFITLEVGAVFILSRILKIITIVVSERKKK